MSEIQLTTDINDVYIYMFGTLEFVRINIIYSILCSIVANKSFLLVFDVSAYRIYSHKRLIWNYSHLNFLYLYRLYIPCSLSLCVVGSNLDLLDPAGDGT